MKIRAIVECVVDDEKVADYTAEQIQERQDPDVARGNAVMQAAQDELGAAGAIVLEVAW